LGIPKGSSGFLRLIDLMDIPYRESKR
jgi:hypothetical protein